MPAIPSALLEGKLWHSLNLSFLINISELSFGYVIWSWIQKSVLQFWLGFNYTTAAFQSLRKLLSTTLDFGCFWKDHLEFFGACKCAPHLSVRCFKSQALLKVQVNVPHPWGQNWEHPPFQKTPRKGAVSSRFSNTQGSCIQAGFVQCSVICDLRRKLNKVIELPRNIILKSPCKFHSVTLWCWVTSIQHQLDQVSMTLPLDGLGVQKHQKIQ